MAEKRQFLRIARKLCATFVALFAFAIAPAHATLPSGYTELEFIGTTGTQYIDTQAALTANFDLHATIKVRSTLTGVFIGSTTSYNDFFVGVYSSETLNSGISGNVTNGGIPYPGKDIKFSFAISPTRFIGYNGVVRDLSRPYSGNGKLLIGNTETNAKAYFYSIKLYDGDNLSFNGIPAKRNSDGVLGMYDTVSGNFFENQGTGTFIAGPAKCRNLFDKTTVTANKYINPSGSITSDGTNKTVVSGEIYVKPSTTYTLSGVGDIYDASYNRSGFQYQADGTPISAITETRGTGMVTFTTAANCAYVRVMSVTANVDTAMLEEGSTATDYVPFCAPEIKIATTAYNTAAFAPVEAALESAVTTIKDVVANTIVQADAIQNLQDTKQTMPDASGTNGTCPRFRQCLLIETDDGTPQWFQIADPVYDLISSLKNNKVNSSGETTESTFAANGKTNPDSRYYNGYPAMRLKTSAQSSSVNTRPFSSTLLNGANGGQYKMLGEQEWAVTWDGNETGTADSFLPGVIYGTSRCVKTSEAPTTTYAAKVNPDTDGWTTIENSEPLNDLENIESYVQCYCKMTGVGLDGMITPVRDSSQAPWVFRNTTGSAGVCAGDCALGCANLVRAGASFRSAVLGFAAN